MMYQQQLLFHKKSYSNYDCLNLKMDYVTTTSQTREHLMVMLTLCITQGDFMKLACLVTEFNLEFKQCIPSELKRIDDLMRNSKESHLDFYNFYIRFSRYDEDSGSLCFINRIPFLFGNLGVDRSFTPHATRERIRGYPDCIDCGSFTKRLQGWKLRNVVGKQNLPVLKFDCKYDIITSKENFSFYQERYPGCRVRDYSTSAAYTKCPFTLHDIMLTYGEQVTALKN